MKSGKTSGGLDWVMMLGVGTNTKNTVNRGRRNRLQYLTLGAIRKAPLQDWRQRRWNIGVSFPGWLKSPPHPTPCTCPHMHTYAHTVLSFIFFPILVLSLFHTLIPSFTHSLTYTHTLKLKWIQTWGVHYAFLHFEHFVVWYELQHICFQCTMWNLMLPLQSCTALTSIITGQVEGILKRKNNFCWSVNY